MTDQPDGAPAGPAHLLPAVRQVLSWPQEDRIAFAYTDRWIEYPAAGRALRAMGDLLAQPNQTRMRGVLVAARPDNGKTSVLRRFRDLHPATARESGGTSRPVVLASMPDEPSEAKLWSNVLRALMVPHRSTDSARHLREQAVRVLEGDQVRTLMFDEVHDLLHGSARRQRHLLALLKHLTNELSLRIVLAGTQDVVSALAGDKQLATRFDGFALPPWSEGQQLRSMLAGLEAVLPLAEPSGLASREMAQALLGMGGGTVGGMAIRLKHAAGLAIRSGKERIDLALLRKVQDTAGLDYTAVAKEI